MIFLQQKGNTITIVFTCEECGNTYPIMLCSKFEAYDVPRMICEMCRALEKE